ncbi:MAG: extracellular solute-binding protein [Anaerolineae bacterium]|nr:extracellular solute-binding protein [Anaerolineae bacterium]
MNRKRFYLVISLVLLAAMLSSSMAAAQEKTKVVIFVGLGTGTAADQITRQEALAEEFNATHDDIEIEFLIVPHEEANTRYLAMIAGDNPPDLVGPHGTSTIAAYLDTWADITPFIEAEGYDLSDFYPPSLKLNEYPDLNTGLPLGLYPSFLLYNVDMFDAAGVEYPPSDYTDTSWTFDELRSRAMLLTLDENGNDATSPDFDPDKTVQWGFDDSWISIRGLLAAFDAPNVGRPTTDDYKTAVANSDEWVQGLQWFSDGVWKDHFIPSLEERAAYESAGLGTPLDGGLIAMFWSHSWYLAEMREVYFDLEFEMQLAAPSFNFKGTRVARIHADNFTMPEASKNKEAAWEVMKWLSAPEQITEVCLIYGCVPARMSAKDEFSAAMGEAFPGLDLNVIFDSIDYLDTPHHESWVPEWTKVEDTMEYAGGLIFTGENTDAKAVLDEANAEIQALLDEYWAGH